MILIKSFDSENFWGKLVMERCNVHWELYAGDFNLQFCLVCDMGISIENSTALGMSFKKNLIRKITFIFLWRTKQ